MPDTSRPPILQKIWLNLPASSKMSAPHFTMFWSEQIPRQLLTDALGRATEVAVIAGQLQGSERRCGGGARLRNPWRSMCRLS